jgi:hypothetical protein
VRVFRAIVAAVVIASCMTAAAREFPIVPQPILLRLTGRIALDRAAARAERPDVVGLRMGDDVRWMAVDQAVTLNDHTLSGRAVLNMLAPFQSILVVVGAAELRERLASAPANALLSIEGLVDRGSRTFLLRDVHEGAPTSAP